MSTRVFFMKVWAKLNSIGILISVLLLCGAFSPYQDRTSQTIAGKVSGIAESQSPANGKHKLTGPIYPCFVNPAVRTNTRKYIQLNDGWHFREDPNEQGIYKGWDKGKEKFDIPAKVPGGVWALEELAPKYPSYNQPNRYEGTCWYQKHFDLTKDWDYGKLWLKFGGVTPTAHVWLNGRYLGYHNHPNVGFKFDITDAAIIDGTNVLTLELAWRDLEMRGGLSQCGPGIYGGVELEKTGSVRIEDLFIRPRIDDSEVWVSAVLHNDSPDKQEFRLQTHVSQYKTGKEEKTAQGDFIQLAPSESDSVLLKIDMSGCHLWTADDPFLYAFTLEVLSGTEVTDAVTERFGMRQMAVEGKSLTLNHQPLMWRAVADEFLISPTITPLVDKEIIRRVITKMKEMGFNGKRYHTHVPTREELDICDELGFLIEVEPSVISNFNQIKPYPANRASWINKIKEVRNHPSVVVFSMGNETSQIMWDKANREQAKVFWEDAQQLVPDRLILSGCGFQGEYPEVPNDFQTPHLWSQSWKWAYEGLSDVPWNALQHLGKEGPLVIHEYGKMTVWSDTVEDRFFKNSGMPLYGNYGEKGLLALKKAGLERFLPEIVLNSRKLSAVCTKISIEQARRQPEVYGYHYHCALRVTHNRGFIDDLGYHVDPQFSELPFSNGNTALLMDRDYRNRTFTEGQPVNLNIYLSHFGENEIKNAILTWSLMDGKKTIQTGRFKKLNFPQGEYGLLQKLKFNAPAGLGKFTLHVQLEAGDVELAKNKWDFWRFPFPSKMSPANVAIKAVDKQWEYDMKSYFPDLRRFDDIKSAYFGINRLSNSVKDSILSSHFVNFIIADQWTDDLNQYVKRGGTVLLFDRSFLPDEWYAKDKEQGEDYSIYRLYTPFRTGWDHGNAATIIQKHPVLKDFPNEGWCDLQFYEMIEGSATLKTHMLPGEPTPIIRVIPMARRVRYQEGAAPDSHDLARPKSTEDRFYLAETKLGNGRLIVCSLRLGTEPAGRYLLEHLVEYAGSKQSKK